MAAETKNPSQPLHRVDKSLIPKSQVGTDVYQNVRIVQQSTTTIRGEQGNQKVIFAPPNTGFLNLREMTLLADLTLDGSGSKGGFPFKQDANNPSVWKWAGDGADPDPAFPPDAVNHVVYTNNILPGLSDKFYHSMIQRIVVQAGGTTIVDTGDKLNLYSAVQDKFVWNSNYIIPSTSTYGGYNADNGDHIAGSPYSGYWEYPERLLPITGTRFYELRSAPQPFFCKLMNFPNALLGKTDGILPLSMMPNVSIEIYFGSNTSVLKQALPPGYTYNLDSTAITGALTYYLENIQLRILMAGSNSLETAVIHQGLSMTHRNFDYYTRSLPTVKGNISVQVPVTRRAIEKVYVIIRNPEELNSINVAGKQSSFWPIKRELSQANIRINGIKRYSEDLDQRGMFQELRALEPEAAMSELFNDQFRDWGGRNNILIFNVQMDYSREFISGVKTASQTSPLILDMKFTSDDWKPNDMTLEMGIFVQFVTWMSVTREAIEVID